MFLYDLPPQRKNVPELVKDPVQLIKDVRILVERHCKDSRELAITGKPVLHPDLNQSNNLVLNQRLEEIIAKHSSHNEENATNAPDEDETNANEGGNASDNDNNETKNFPAPPPAVTKPVAVHKPAKASNRKNNDGTNGNERSNGNSAPRRRRRRCKVCVPCNATECGHCAFCLDMVSIEVIKFSRSKS